ncbi:MAG: hypothetical protein R6U44_02160 [Archaeoglobaceae archaeon]
MNQLEDQLLVETCYSSSFFTEHNGDRVEIVLKLWYQDITIGIPKRRTILSSSTIPLMIRG